MFVAAIALGLALAPAGMPRHAQVEAADGLVVELDHWDHDREAGGATLVLFHQAGGSKHEYGTIAPRLFDRGYDVVVVSQRSGGRVFHKTGNKTHQRYLAALKAANKPRPKKGAVPYLEAMPDLKAAVAFAKREHPGAPLAVWGSSYSSAMVFLLAAEDTDIDGVLAFSPGEYLKDKGTRVSVAKAAAQVNVPVFIATPANEAKRAAPIAKAVPRPTSLHLPPGAVHGSSMLNPQRSKTSEQTWKLVEAFLAERFAVPMPAAP
jgi:dienelactone hydrolase